MFKIGKIFGVKISLHWTLLILLYLLVSSLPAQIISGIPETSLTLATALSIIISVLFIASILAHELAHAAVGNKLGISCRNITLFVLGGMAKIDGEIKTAGEEFRIAIAGPIMSLILGIVFSGIALLLNLAENIVSDYVAICCLFVGIINIMLSVFNMIPAYPADGGRVLRSAIWAITKNYRLATKIAGRMGQGFAILFVIMAGVMIYGIEIPFFGVGLVSGIWIGVIGVLLFMMAKAELDRLDEK